MAKQPLNIAKLKAVADTANYTKTDDPDVVIGKHGATITRQQYQESLKQPNNNMKFNTFEDFADWYGGWAGKTGTQPQQKPAEPVQPGNYPPKSNLERNNHPAVEQTGKAVPTIRRVNDQ